MNGVFGLPITVDWLWFSSMITKIRFTAAFAPLSGLLADAEAAGTTTAAARAPAASSRVSLWFARMDLLSRGAWMSPAPGTLEPAPASSGSRPRHRGANDIAIRGAGVSGAAGCANRDRDGAILGWPELGCRGTTRAARGRSAGRGDGPTRT